MRPRLSVIIATMDGKDTLGDCLASFAQQPHGDEIEIVVAASSNAASAICAEYPNVRLLRCQENKSIPELRAEGLLNAQGDILAITEDHCLADARWIENALRAHESPHLAIGGPVENAAKERLVDWAVFFCEYGRYMRPVAPGPTTDLPGPNVTYKRAALEQFRDLLSPATWEPFWHHRLMENGVALVNNPKMVMYHRKHFTVRGFLAERYYYARSFAGTRVQHAAWFKRALFALAAPLLPPLLLGRIVTRVWRKGRQRRQLLLALPYIALFTVSWAVGEWVGYLFGPGNSLQKIV